MCRPDQSARTAQADLVDTLRRCLSPKLYFGNENLLIMGNFYFCRHVVVFSKPSAAEASTPSVCGKGFSENIVIGTNTKESR